MSTDRFVSEVSRFEGMVEIWQKMDLGQEEYGLMKVRSKGLCKSCWTLQSLASERLFITTPNVVKNKMKLWTPTDLRLSQCVLLQREVKNL